MRLARVPSRGERIEGVLLGTAIGDALGLPCEGMSARAIARRFGAVDRYRLLGRRGYVSDDTELTALVARALSDTRAPDAAARVFGRSLVGWLVRLPWAIGLTTLRACVRLALGVRPSGVRGAGNGAAMRAAIVGVVVADAGERRAVGRALAEVTHTDPRAVEAALYVAEVAHHADGGSARSACEAGRGVVSDPELARAIDDALVRAATAEPADVAARALGTTGFSVHTAAWATYAFARWSDSPRRALAETVAAGGDTDSIAAIVGAWCGARGGVAALPAELVADLEDGPFGRSHLRALARSLTLGAPAPPIGAARALLRNLALFPVIVGHALTRRIL